MPHDAPLPTGLVSQLTRWRLQQVNGQPVTHQPARRAPAPPPAATNPATDVNVYHLALTEVDRATCDALFAHVVEALPDAVGKVWHGHPVFFIPTTRS